MKRQWLMLALLLPVVGLLASAVVRQTSMRSAEEWRIPITGFDPRDPLRGQYVRYRYGWRVTGAADLCRRDDCHLCLEHAGGTVTARIVPAAASCAAKVDVAASNISVGRTFPAGGAPTFSTRIFVSEVSAPRIERMLREGPAEIVALLTPAGRLVPQRIEAAED